jgi:hypothetical protein
LVFIELDVADGWNAGQELDPIAFSLGIPDATDRSMACCCEKSAAALE